MDNINEINGAYGFLVEAGAVPTEPGIMVDVPFVLNVKLVYGLVGDGPDVLRGLAVENMEEAVVISVYEVLTEIERVDVVCMDDCDA